VPYNLLIIPLIAGYYLLSNLVYFKYKYQRQESQRLLLNSALAGLFIAIVTFFIRHVVEFIYPEFIPKVYNWLARVINYQSENTRFLWTMLSGLLITIAITRLINFVIRKFPNIAADIVERAVIKHGNEL
jgi:hypothetical protein